MVRKLKKDLGIFDLFCISSGAMISSGLFVLPGLAFARAGPSVIVSYIIASVVIIPAFLSTTELATAMPRAGGNYFFADRSMGPWVGTLVGLSDWFSLALKSAFALIGIGSFAMLLFPGITDIQIKIIAVSFCVILAIINVAGIKQSGRFQAMLVISLLVILTFYIIYGSFYLEGRKYTPFAPFGYNSVFATAGLVCVTFGGLTKIPNIAEEVKNPGRSIPMAMFLSWIVVSIIYALVVAVTIGLVNPAELEYSLFPISAGAGKLLGFGGSLLLGVAALLAYVTTATAGLLTASRTPFAMSRDRLLPDFFQKISRRHTPANSIVITSVFMIIVIIFLDLEGLVKVASTSFLFVYMFNNFSVIFMRRGKISYYQPKYKAPFYPYLQIIGILIYGFLIIEMGLVSIISAAAFTIISVLWFLFYGRKNIERDHAISHIINEIKGRNEKECVLGEELRDILLDEGSATRGRFKKKIKNALIIDLDEVLTRNQFLELVSENLSNRLGLKARKIHRLLRRDRKELSILIHSGVACINAHVPGKNKFEIVLIRDRKGITLSKDESPVYAAFVVAYSPDRKDFFLNSLVWIVDIAENTDFDRKWLDAESKEELRDIIKGNIR
jgi:basic amino acid/polyamine antiporter, APA family